jgi:hypothetical protein
MNQYRAQDGFCAIALVACCVLVISMFALSFASSAEEDVRGKPLNAPKEDVKGAPLDGITTDEPSPEPIRVIPESSLDLVRQLEGVKEGADLFKFEKAKDGEHLKVTFAALGSFPYEIPDRDAILQSEDPSKAPVDQIPEEIKALDKEKIVLVGFMVPIDVDRRGQIKSFALTQNQQFCCFGVPPAMNEWVMVEMAEGETAEYVSDLPIAVFGDFKVGEEIEDGYVMSVYRMAGNDVMDVRELIKRAEGD